MQTDIRPSRRVVSVPLSAPVEWFGKMLSSIDVEEPSAALFFEIGPPQIVAGNGSGAGAWVDVSDALKAYVSRCVKVDNADHLMNLLPLSDGKAIKRALLGFFQDSGGETSS